MPGSRNHATRSNAGRSVGRDDQIKWGAIAASAFAVIGLVGLGLAAYDWRTSAPPDDANRPQPRFSSTAHKEEPPLGVREGKVVSREGDKCKVMIFDNETGRSGGDYGACADEGRADGRYNYPTSRLRSIRAGFAKD